MTRPERQLRQLRDPERWVDAEWPAPQQKRASARSQAVRFAVATAGVLATIVAVTFGLTHLPRPALPAGPGSPTPNASETPIAARTPCPTLGDGVAPFSCSPYVSTLGQTPGGAIDWLRDGSLKLSFRYLNGQPSVLLTTPCNGGSAPLHISARIIVPAGSLSSTAMGCPSARIDHQNFAFALFRQPLTYRINGDTLTLEQGHSIVVVLKAQG